MFRNTFFLMNLRHYITLLLLLFSAKESYKITVLASADQKQTNRKILKLLMKLNYYYFLFLFYISVFSY